VLLGALAAIAVAVWATGQLSARLFSGAWLDLDAGQMGGVLARLAGNPSDPAAAWPGAAAGLVPGPVAFWSVFAVLLLGPLVGTLLVHGRLRSRRRAGEAPSAAWASGRDLRPLRVRESTRGRITIGRAGGMLLAAEPRQSLIVIGPSQSGKTTGLAMPAILEWDGPVIATSVKSDLLRDTITARRHVGGVWVYDPTGTSGHRGPTATWSPLAGCDTWQGAQRTAAWLVEAGRSDGGLQEADFWHATAAKLLAPLLFAAATSHRTMADVVRWVDTQEEREVRFELELADPRRRGLLGEGGTPEVLRVHHRGDDPARVR
jgi:type IV secretion system protein VirD4